MEYLKEGATVFEEHFFHSWEDLQFLRKMIRHYPFDAFVDHAYYFTHQFDQVIGTESIIEDVSILAASQREDTGSPKQIALLKRYLEGFPNGPRVDDVSGALIAALLSSGSP